MAVEEFSARLGLRIEFDYRIPAQTVGSHQIVHLVQITREALNNIVKHAGASRVGVTASLVSGALVLSICDNGCGLPPAHQRQHHYGLIIMQDRAASLQGSCQITRRPSGGTEVRVTVPLEPVPPTDRKS